MSSSAPMAPGAWSGRARREAPAASARQSAKSALAEARFVVVLRKRAGMIWSVSMSSLARATTCARLKAVNGSRRSSASALPPLEKAPAGRRRARATADAAAVRRRRREGASPSPWPPLEVAVARAHGVLAGAELVAVHRDAHRASRLAPLGAGLAEDGVEPLGLGLPLHALRAGHDERPDRRARPCAHESRRAAPEGRRCGHWCTSR